jgi:hypothetical protein
MWRKVTPGAEYAALSEIFAGIPASNFSQEVLAARPNDLAVFPVRGLTWTDLDEPQRLESVHAARVDIHAGAGV